VAAGSWGGGRAPPPGGGGGGGGGMPDGIGLRKGSGPPIRKLPHGRRGPAGKRGVETCEVVAQSQKYRVTLDQFGVVRGRGGPDIGFKIVVKSHLIAPFWVF